MEKKTISLKELKKRKMLLILPVLILPFVTMLFWSLGGGKGTLEIVKTEGREGFNSVLPDPKFKNDDDFDKMSYYEQAVIDSAKLQEQIKKDPNYSSTVVLGDSVVNWDQELGTNNFRKGKVALNTSSFKDQNEQRVYEKLKALQNAISQPKVQISQSHDMREFEGYGTSEASGQMEKLEQMMSVMNEPQEADPELKQLGGMLENILDIQHPARVQEKLKQSYENKKSRSLTVAIKTKENNLTSLQSVKENKENTSKQNSFYAFDEEEVSFEEQNAIEAVIHETQTIVNGSTIKLRLSNDVLIQGKLIPRNSFLFGIASLQGERLEIKISNIKYANSIFPVELSVFDMDGIKGVFIPGAISRDVSKASADRSIQTLGVSGLDDLWGVQAAGMGIEAAKSFMSKKVKLIKVVVKAGYRILLYDEKQKNSN
ncbi:conjugative transposon protein TraM [Flavobacterium sp. FlaQc-57]|uniref:conjugative transposon protein TraM n=1 Tax=Flavobacterium sp. FlaQc-57 TaxID=3374186 RepID=UPI0037569C9D